jgi:hypothetical protein
MRRAFRAILALTFVGALCGAAVAEGRLGQLTIDSPWARPTAGPARTGAAYLTIVNHGAEPDRLLGADSVAARMVGIHESRVDSDGMMRMRPVEAVEVPAGGEVRLEPGGLHVMLMGLAAPLVAGDSFPLRLRFERAGEVEIEVAVQQP